MNPMKRSRRLVASFLATTLFGILQLGGLLVGGLPAEAKGPKAGNIELSFLNGEYGDLDQKLRPVQQGPLTIKLSSPDHQLFVHRNQLNFRSEEPGRIDALIEVEFEGGGALIADIEGAGVSTQFDDRVSAERQVMVVEGPARLEKVDGGYRITLLERPKATPIEIESELIGQIVGLCTGLDSIPLLSLDCPALDRALTQLEPPMPEAGEQFFLSSDRLNNKERRFFNRYAVPAR